MEFFWVDKFWVGSAFAGGSALAGSSVVAGGSAVSGGVEFAGLATGTKFDLTRIFPFPTVLPPLSPGGAVVFCCSKKANSDETYL